jgi:serine/threonine protein kinase
MADRIGARLGSCVILRRLAGGGMGEIFLAEQPDLGRQVAVKVIRAQDGNASISQSATARFINEARAVAALEHPNILPIYEFGEHEGLNYLVMQYVPSGSLADLLAAGTDARFRLPMAPALVNEIVTQAAAALQFAHDRHVVHLDVKPHNMLVRLLDAPVSADPSVPPHVLLADFGLARFFTGAPATHLSGTPLYAPPEQYAGTPQPASDQYTLAGVAFELLTGRTVFTGKVQELQQQHMSATPPPATSVNPRLPRGVDAVLSRALAKQPTLRYESVRAFAQALSQAVAPPAQLSVPHPPNVSVPGVGSGYLPPHQMGGPPPLIPPPRAQPQNQMPPVAQPPAQIAPATPAQAQMPLAAHPQAQMPLLASIPMPPHPPQMALAPGMPVVPSPAAPHVAPQAPMAPASPASAAGQWPHTVTASPPTSPPAMAWPATASQATPQSPPQRWPTPGTAPIIGASGPMTAVPRSPAAPGWQPGGYSAPARLLDAAPTLGQRGQRRWNDTTQRNVLKAIIAGVVTLVVLVSGILVYNALNVTTVIVESVPNPCAKVTAFAHDGPASSPAPFTGVTFPKNSLSSLGPTQTAYNGYHEQRLFVCSPGPGVASVADVQTFFATSLPAHGWQQTATFPGNADDICGDAYCWTNATHDYIGLFFGTGDGRMAVGTSTVILYHVRLDR